MLMRRLGSHKKAIEVLLNVFDAAPGN